MNIARYYPVLLRALLEPVGNVDLVNFVPFFFFEGSLSLLVLTLIVVFGIGAFAWVELLPDFSDSWALFS